MALSGIYYADAVIKLVEDQVKQMGGILGGRLLKIVKFDNRGTVSEASAGATKLVDEDEVSAIVFGGASAAESTAVANKAEDLHVLFVSLADIENIADKKFSVVAVPVGNTITNNFDKLVKALKPATVGFLVNDEMLMHQNVDIQKKMLEAVGINVNYTQFVPIGTIDFTPYLTKLKYANPDVVVLSTLNEGFTTVAKQITELGGWGNIKVVCNPAAILASRQPGAKGWFILVSWYPGRDYPASHEFEDYFKTVNGKSPDPNHVYYYLCLWTALNAMKMAGTDDPVAVAQVARSGNLQWDTPAGVSHIRTTGESDLNFIAVQVQESGKLLPFDY